MSQSSQLIREAFDSLLTENKKALLQLFVPKRKLHTFSEGEQFTFNNQSTPGFLWVFDGAAREATTDNVCHQFFLAGDFIGLEEMLTEKSFALKLQFISPINHFLFVSEYSFLKLQKVQPGIATPLIRKIHKDVTTLEERAIGISKTSTAKRLEQLFASFQKRWGKQTQDWVPLKFSMDDLAQMVGASRNTIVRIIKSQKDQGILELEDSRFRWLGQPEPVSKF